MPQEQKAFADRYAAGRSLFKILAPSLAKSGRLIVSIPNGGTLVASTIAEHLKQPMYVTLSKKIPLEGIAYVGIGAFSDPVELLNIGRITELHISSAMVKKFAGAAINEAQDRRAILGAFECSEEHVFGKDVLLIDDGIASGYTMKAAVLSLRRYKPRSITLGVPVVSYQGLCLVRQLVDAIYYCHIGYGPQFLVDRHFTDFHAVPTSKVQELLLSAASR